jgi:hypothetical protein
MLKPILGIEMNLRTVAQIISNILVLLLIVVLASLVIGKKIYLTTLHWRVKKNLK